MINYRSEFRTKLSAWLDGNTNIYFYWKGRVALYAILKAMGVGKDDEVILPGFTCVVVANAIKYLGAKPVYIDIEKQTLNPSAEAFQAAATDKTKVVIVQNTFGLSTDVDIITDWAKSKGYFTVEDCTHGFGGRYKDKANGTWCDASFFSSQWNKPFSTGIGGFALINNDHLEREIQAVNSAISKPGLKDRKVLSALLFARKWILTPSNYWRLRSFYRFLSKYKIVVGSSEGQELTGVDMPDDYFLDMSDVQFKSGIKVLGLLDEQLQLRKTNAVVYTDFLKQNGKYHVANDLFDSHSFLKYPVLVKNRKGFELKAEKAKIELGDWFCSPLHPVIKDLTIWDMDEATVPLAVEVSKQIVNIPLDIKNIDSVIHFLELNMEDLL